MKKPQLPEKVSELIRLALADLRKIEGDNRYVVNMMTWHVPTWHGGSEECSVCLAGAVMAKTLHAEICQRVDPIAIAETQHDLMALIGLNELRIGNFSYAASSFCNTRESREVFESVCRATCPDGLASYHDEDDDENRSRFYDDFNRLADALEREGF